jgi:hypothetical protein
MSRKSKWLVPCLNTNICKAPKPQNNPQSSFSRVKLKTPEMGLNLGFSLSKRIYNDYEILCTYTLLYFQRLDMYAKKTSWSHLPGSGAAAIGEHPEETHPWIEGHLWVPLEHPPASDLALSYSGSGHHKAQININCVRNIALQDHNLNRSVLKCISDMSTIYLQ